MYWGQSEMGFGGSFWGVGVSGEFIKGEGARWLVMGGDGVTGGPIKGKGCRVT